MRGPVKIFTAVLGRLHRPRVWRLTGEAAIRQWWSREDLLRYGKKKLRSLSIHAEKNVPYYREKFRAQGIDPSSINYFDNWSRLPILTKETLRSEFELIKATNVPASKAKLNMSGGSTGVPVSFFSDLDLYDIMDAYLNLVFSWAGWESGEMCLYLWGGQDSLPSLKGMRSLKTRLAGRAIVSVLTYNKEILLKWWKILRNYRPTIIYGYPSVIANFAGWLEDKGYEPVGIKGVFTTAEMLLPSQRERIERVFSCKVYNQYGSRETPSIACECPEGNMHFFVDINHVEFLKGSEDMVGPQNIVVSPLHNYAQPLLRYDLGDMGSPKEGTCPCGRGYPLMKIEMGRDRDHLIALDGRRVYPGFFTRLIDGVEWVSSFQFRQVKPDLIILDIKSLKNKDQRDSSAALKREILPHVRSMMGQRVDLQVRLVESIDCTSLGKYRYVINEIDNNQ